MDHNLVLAMLVEAVFREQETPWDDPAPPDSYQSLRIPPHTHLLFKWERNDAFGEVPNKLLIWTLESLANHLEESGDWRPFGYKIFQNGRRFAKGYLVTPEAPAVVVGTSAMTRNSTGVEVSKRLDINTQGSAAAGKVEIIRGDDGTSHGRDGHEISSSPPLSPPLPRSHTPKRELATKSNDTASVFSPSPSNLLSHPSSFPSNETLAPIAASTTLLDNNRAIVIKTQFRQPLRPLHVYSTNKLFFFLGLELAPHSANNIWTLLLEYNERDVVVRMTPVIDDSNSSSNSNSNSNSSNEASNGERVGGGGDTTEIHLTVLYLRYFLYKVWTGLFNDGGFRYFAVDAEIWLYGALIARLTVEGL